MAFALVLLGLELDVVKAVVIVVVFNDGGVEEVDIEEAGVEDVSDAVDEEKRENAEVSDVVASSDVDKASEEDPVVAAAKDVVVSEYWIMYGERGEIFEDDDSVEVGKGVDEDSNGREEVPIVEGEYEEEVTSVKEANVADEMSSIDEGISLEEVSSVEGVGSGIEKDLASGAVSV